MNEPVKIAILGCGAVSQDLHAPALVELQRRKLVAVTALLDPNPGQAKAMASFFPAARSLGSLLEIGRSGCELALVASPVRFHAEQAIACFKAGLSVLCEKPVAASAREAEAMTAAARAGGKLFAAGHVRRHFATTQLIKRIIGENSFGRIVSFRAAEGGSFAWAAQTASFFQKDVGGGGVLMDTGIHSLDLLFWWLGEPLSFAYEDDAMGGVEANCRLALDYGKFRGEVQLTRDYEIPTGYLLEFERAWIRWQPYSADRLEIGFPGSPHSLRSQLVAADREDDRLIRHRLAAPFSHSFLLQWENVVAAVRGREVLRAPGEEAARSVVFVERCYAARRFMEPPWFTEREKDSARALHRRITE